MAGIFGALKTKSKAKILEKKDEKQLEEEILSVQQELRMMKSEISHQCRKNYELEKELRRYDSKIAHLIHHKISLEEFEEYCMDESAMALLPGSLKDDSQQQPFQLHLSKLSKLYGNLFFLLQASPTYLAKLTRQVSMREIDSLLQPVMFSLYGNQYEDREECLLLSMFEHALMMEFQDARDMNSLMRANTAITRMMTTYTKRGPGMKYVKEALGDIVQDIVANDISIEINPLDIYQRMIENEEVPDPQDSTKVSQLAECNPLVQRKVSDNLKILRDIAIRIFQRLKDTIESVPYGIRWLCKAIRVLVKEKFPEASAEYCQSLIGGFFILRLVNPVIVTPHVYHLLPNPPSSKVRRNLTLIAKVIQKLGNVGNVREPYMKPLEGFVKGHNEEFKTFLSNLSNVDDFHETLLMEEYMALSRTDLFIEISLKEIRLIHSLLNKYADKLVSEEDNLLQELLVEIPPLPEDEAIKSTSTIKLRLCNKWSDKHVSMGITAKNIALEDVEDELATARRHCRNLLIKLGHMAPKCLAEDVLDNVVRLALTLPMEEIETNAKLIDGYTRKMRQLDGLEDGGKALIQEVRLVLPSIKDIHKKHYSELEGLSDVKKTLQLHSEYLKEQITTYQEYLQAVRVKVGEMHHPGHVMKKGKSAVHQYSHSQLEKEGVILETQGIPEQRRNNIFYTFSCPEPGIYHITMHYKGKSDPIYEKILKLEELLELQYVQDPMIDMEGFVLLNVRRTLLLLNRLFVKGESQHRGSIQRRLSLSLSSATSVKS